MSDENDSSIGKSKAAEVSVPVTRKTSTESESDNSAGKKSRGRGEKRSRRRRDDNDSKQSNRIIIVFVLLLLLAVSIPAWRYVGLADRQGEGTVACLVSNDYTQISAGGMPTAGCNVQQPGGDRKISVIDLRYTLPR